MKLSALVGQTPFDLPIAEFHAQLDSSGKLRQLVRRGRSVNASVFLRRV